MGSRILIADDEANIRKVLAKTLEREGYDVVAVKDGQEALEVIEHRDVEDDPIGVVVTDLRMPRLDGLGLLSKLRESAPDIPVILITAHGTVDTAVTALKQGAFDYVTKPFDQVELLRVIRKAATTRELGMGDARVTRVGTGYRHRLVGDSTAIRQVLAVVDKVADSPSTVLVTGESGTGKELVARALHDGSSRRDRPFITINCAAIPKDLMESELFGHEKGAFTGATTSKPGRFELADQGTLFLDEIGELPPEMQVKLLRVLQESEFERVGGIKTLRVDVRLIAATNRDLRQAITEGRFREDLFYRLNVVPVALPPLRERLDDIPPLVEHFITKYNQRLSRQVRHITPEALERLREYPWPGNIRELENIIERSVLFAEGDTLSEKDLPPELAARTHALRMRDTAAAAAPGADPGQGLSRGGALDMKEVVKQATLELEKDLIQRALTETGGNVTHAARRLKISRKSLQNKMKELGLREEQPDEGGGPAA
ncbi:MAG: sigma-54-dependent Fis family transcriptional regulator [Deltaproteobacteria bacterium]|nr:sigma-54-dependent Fis family transcriptional regulator [Deltaproteobacteria bacterium]